ncbi:transcription factor grauzone-like [Anopheles aquasalis]|uniref:transcription factor grauzone-like n=1 Tax=Anopheles aquasalis TaxID=42839 RepID=UPI00215B6B88|nr:transcription factor grauzone-like [Anopheles aquasalis]
METGVSICSLCLQNEVLLKFASEDSKEAAISVVACYFLFEQNIIPKHQICIGCWQQLTAFDRFSTQVKLAHELYFKQAGTDFSYVAEDEEKSALVLKDGQKIFAVQQLNGGRVDFQDPERDTSQLWPEGETDNTSEASNTLTGSERDETQSIIDATPSTIEAPPELTEDLVNGLDANVSQISERFEKTETESADESGEEILRMTQTKDLQMTSECRQQEPSLLEDDDWQETLPFDNCDEPEYLDGSEDGSDSDVSAQLQTQESTETETQVPTMNNLQQESGDEENSLLGMILMDIDNEVDFDQAEDAPDKSKLSAPVSSVRQNRRTDELIRQHCNLDCVICGAKSSTFPQVMRHFQEEHKIKGHITCCGEQYTNRRNLLDHVILQNDPNAFTCSQCSQSYLSNIAYRSHLSTHDKPDGIFYACEFCDMQFPKRLLLMIHRKHHKAYKCDQCDASFKLRRELQAHKIEHQDANFDVTNEEFVCKVCLKSYRTKENARRHYANVHGPVRYMCESCPESFKSHFAYYYHKKTKHSEINVKPVQCNICQRWLKSAANLSTHMFLHDPNKKPLVCDICGKIAKHPESLRSHKRYVHAKECPFECIICKKTFVRKKALKEHMAVHTGESLYQCTFCPRTFKSGANMHSHRKKKHPAEMEEHLKERSDQLRAIYEKQNGQTGSDSTPVPS